MILSSADILKILGGSEVIRLSASISIVDSKPPLSGAEGLFIYINRFPSINSFEATWTIWVESDGSEPDDLVLTEIKRLLPKVTVTPGLMTVLTTTDSRSETTQEAPQDPKASQAQEDPMQYEERFQKLLGDVRDRMLFIRNGKDGQAGRNGKDGANGRDGKDLNATEVELEDLADVGRGIPLQKGQVLTWDGQEWTNLFIPQALSTSSASGIEEAPQDDNYYVRQNGAWVNLTDALSALGVPHN